MKNGSSCYSLMAHIVAERVSRMGQGTSQLREQLLLARNTKIPICFTCAECFALIEHDADLLAAGVPMDKLRPSIRHHLSPYAQGVSLNLANGLEGLRAREILNPDPDWV